MKFRFYLLFMSGFRREDSFFYFAPALNVRFWPEADAWSDAACLQC